jgi:hypothetical protein
MFVATPSLPAPAASPLRNAAKTGLELTVNIVLPVLVFDLSRASLGDAHALMISAIPPIAWSVVEFARKRKLDAVSLIVLTGIALSLIAFFGGGGVKFLQLRESLVAGLIGLIFLTSVMIGRPLIGYLAHATMARTSPQKAAVFAGLRETPRFRRALTIMTLAWGVGLVAECAVAASLTFVLSVQQFVIASPLVGYGSMGAITAWTIWFARRRIGPPIKAAMDTAEPDA